MFTWEAAFVATVDAAAAVVVVVVYLWVKIWFLTNFDRVSIDVCLWERTIDWSWRPIIIIIIISHREFKCAPGKESRACDLPAAAKSRHTQKAPKFTLCPPACFCFFLFQNQIEFDVGKKQTNEQANKLHQISQLSDILLAIEQ